MTAFMRCWSLKAVRSGAQRDGLASVGALSVASVKPRSNGTWRIRVRNDEPLRMATVAPCKHSLRTDWRAAKHDEGPAEADGTPEMV